MFVAAGVNTFPAVLRTLVYKLAIYVSENEIILTNMKLPNPWWGEIATAVSLQDANVNHFSLSYHFYPDFSCYLFYGMLCLSSGPWSLWIELKNWIDRGQMCVCVCVCVCVCFVMHPRDPDQVKLKNQNSKNHYC